MYDTPMRLDKRLSKVRDGARKDDLLVAYVVVGDGDTAGSIKTVRFHKNVSAQVLRCDWATNGSDSDVLVAVNVRLDLADRGWALLRDLYDAEDNAAGYDIWLSYQEACKKQQVEPGQQFPEHLLPKSVVDLRRGRRKKAVWQPPEIKDDKAKLASKLPKAD